MSKTLFASRVTLGAEAPESISLSTRFAGSAGRTKLILKIPVETGRTLAKTPAIEFNWACTAAAVAASFAPTVTVTGVSVPYANSKVPPGVASTRFRSIVAATCAKLTRTFAPALTSADWMSARKVALARSMVVVSVPS